MKKILSVILACIMLTGIFGCVSFADNAYSQPVSISVESDSANRMVLIPVLRDADGIPVIDEDAKYIVANPASKLSVTADRLTYENGAPVFDTAAIYAAAADKTAIAQELKELDFFDIPAYGMANFYEKTVSEEDGEVVIELNKVRDPYIPSINYVAKGSDFMFTVIAVGSYAFDQTVIIKAYGSSFAADIIKGKDVGKEVSPDENGLYTLSSIGEDTLLKCYNLQDESLAGIKDFLFNLGNFFLRIIRWFFGIKA